MLGIYLTFIGLALCFIGLVLFILYKAKLNSVDKDLNAENELHFKSNLTDMIRDCVGSNVELTLNETCLAFLDSTMTSAHIVKFDNNWILLEIESKKKKRTLYLQAHLIESISKHINE